MYIRRKEDCYEINAGHGEFVYELVGLDNGGTKKHSIAYVDILQGGFSQAHFHPESEESYVIMEGEGRLVIEGKTVTVKPGDVAKIPVGKTHQIFNDRQDTLSFYCTCSPAWTQEGFVPVKQQVISQSEEKKEEIYVRKKEDCEEIKTGRGEFIYEMLGVTNGNAQQHSIAQVEIVEGGFSTPHLHPESEESYIIFEGQGKLVINGEEKIIRPGDVATIPTGKVHQIFNESKKTFKLYAVCAPAWTPECSVYLK